MRFIHISDLHFRRSDQKDIEIILGAFEESLTKEAKAGPIDLAFFTGDLVYSGDELDDFVSAEKLLCDAVTRATGIPRTRVILCPGNHDVSQKAYRADDMIDSALTSKLSSVATANDFFDNTAAYASYLELSLRPLANYRRFEEQHYDDMPLSPHELIRIRSVVVDDRLIGICIFNSAWRSTGGAGNDHKRLIIGERLVDLALEQVRNADMRIAVVHHPLDWLADFELQAVEAISTNDLISISAATFTHQSRKQSRAFSAI